MQRNAGHSAEDGTAGAQASVDATAASGMRTVAHANRHVGSPPFLDDLAAVEQQVWGLLKAGVHGRTSAFHTPTLATVSENGPQARTVTLRSLERPTRRLTFNIDARSTLAAELQADPRVALHGYGYGERTQLRLNGHARLRVCDTVASRAWTMVNASARRCYLVPPPGSASPTPSSGLPPELEQRAPSALESASAFDHFCVVEVTLERIDWLYLHAQHKRRARFTWSGERWRWEWLTP